MTLFLSAPSNARFVAQVSSKYALALGLALHIFATQCCPKKDETAVHCCDPALSVRSCWCLETSFA